MTSGATRAPRGGMVRAMAGPPSAREPRAADRRRAMRAPAQVLAGLAAVVLATPGLALATGAAGKAAQAQESPQDARTGPVRTAKERLSGKAADEQRVDNCKVPLALRGPKFRPDDCGAGVPEARQR
jgi:hypothetical protein